MYERLLLWAVWVTNRKNVPDRRDDVAGDFRLSETTLRSIEEIRPRYFPQSIEAIEKALGRLRTTHDGYALYYLIEQYFLKWLSVERIAAAENRSEFHIVNDLHRAMRAVSRLLGECGT